MNRSILLIIKNIKLVYIIIIDNDSWSEVLVCKLPVCE